MNPTTSKDYALKPGFFGEKTVIIAKSGYGKSYTARVIIEEGISGGHSFLVIDPQDAYLNLPGFDYVNAASIKKPAQYGVLLAKTHKNVVVRTKNLSVDEQNKLVAQLLGAYKQYIDKGIQTIVIDEGHKYAPEGEKTAAKEIVRGMFQENRSDGLGIIIITQRPARLDKTILSQADNVIIGRVTSARDKQAVANYMDNPADIEKVSTLERGQFYFHGCGLDAPTMYPIRASTTKHSGDSPQHILREESTPYNSHKSRFVKRGNTMDTVTTKNELVEGVIPSTKGFMQLVGIGMKASLGVASAGFVGSFVGSRFASPIPVISSRTLGSAATTVVLYAGYRFVQQETFKDVLKYAAAGSAAFTAGSLVWDVLKAANVNLPSMANAIIVSSTGAAPEMAQSEQAGVDLDTRFA